MFQKIVGFRVRLRGTKAHWVNLLQFYQLNNVKILVTVWYFRKYQDIIMSVDTDYPLVFMVNEDFAAVLLLLCMEITTKIMKNKT